MTRRHVAAMWLTATLWPGIAFGQGVANSFDELAKILRAGDTVTVTERSGQQARGKVMRVANGFLTIERGSASSTFAQTDVATVTRRDRPTEGLLIGAGAGVAAGFVFLRGACERDDPECSIRAGLVGFLTMVPAGTVAGFLIDKYTGGGDRVFRAPGVTKTSVAIAPAIGRRAGGISVLVRF